MGPLKITVIVFQCINLILLIILIKIVFGSREGTIFMWPLAALATLIIFTFVQMDNDNLLMLHLSLIPTYIVVLIGALKRVFLDKKK